MDSEKVLELLFSKKNVLIMGAPGTGKSRLINEVANDFETGLSPTALPQLAPNSSIPIPATPVVSPTSYQSMLAKQNRKVFRTTLHQNSKYRDFLTGIMPKFDGSNGYFISEGILYRANEYAKNANSAALLIIDELNRGPAIEVFGGSIVAIESDKRLDDDNNKSPNTQYFEILNPNSRKYEEYALSPHLYILAAMNQADVSVAPLDVAFLRRWQPITLRPDYKVLYDHFGVSTSDTINNPPLSSDDVYLAMIRALEKINERIQFGRGVEYQLGQGVYLSTAPLGNSMQDTLKFVAECWMMVYSHIEELFFGDINAIAYVLNCENATSPYHMVEVEFAGESKYILKNDDITDANIFDLLLSIIGD